MADDLTDCEWEVKSGNLSRVVMATEPGSACVAAVKAHVDDPAAPPFCLGLIMGVRQVGSPDRDAWYALTTRILGMCGITEEARASRPLAGGEGE